ncbi:helix-turn-helix domain-containing protein [Paenibacillus radicibacter]|uniref:helix-turn-helix domain-containing protein n=1 Tax=Paenibacillus radicibacter TaxID=2972488 RepID=UPI002158B1A9|nr:helix-turn-helix domain-containing protein [Paenibacillus radicibacter]
MVKGAEDIQYPIIRTTNYLEQFIVLPIRRDEVSSGYMVIGPSLSNMPTDEMARNLLNDNDVSQRTQSLWIDYWSSLPIMNKLRLFHVSLLAYKLINGIELEITDVQAYNFQFEHRFVPDDHIELTLSSHQEYSLFHTDSGEELFDHIRKGNKEAVLNLMSTISYGELGVLSKRSHLRNVKNLGICAVAIATREAIRGGVYERLALSLSDLHIQHIEELRHVQAVEIATRDAILDFVERVSESRKGGVSKPIAQCKEYVFTHIYEPITLHELSEFTNLNESYLSHLFKKETGMTFTHYVQQEKIEEAKKLLHLTNDPISTIASKLNFYDQTHLNKIFKKHANLTPKQYRDRRKIE